MKVSIIVPIYNKEKYIDKCIRSIISQAYKNIEIILVDDGSTDDSLKICNKYGKDERVRIFRQENRGVSSARNLGLEKATGERVVFVDADDYIDKDFVSKLSGEKADLIISGYRIDGVDNKPERKNDAALNVVLARKNAKFIVGPVGKIFRTNIIKKYNIKFDEEMDFGEDTCFVLDYLGYVHDINFIDYVGYNNVIIDGTLSRRYVRNIDKQLEKIEKKIDDLTKNIFIRGYWFLRNKKIINNNRKMKGKDYGKSIGIITLLGETNFGNRLQNYALSKYLQELGFSVKTLVVIDYEESKNKVCGFLKYIRFKYLFLTKKKLEVGLKRTKKFKIFDKNIEYYNREINYKSDLGKVNDDFTYFISGSDQVWNCNMARPLPVYFLQWIDFNKRISYAASFGFSKIPEGTNSVYKKYINDMNYISVREDRGKELVEDLTGRKDVEVLIDPTMLLDDKEWDKVSRKPTQIEKIRGKKYILNYFLGDLSEERKREIGKIAKKLDCEVINILDKKDPFYNTGPSEFLWLEKHAELICTDSFHSCVFAILYNRPFVIFDREEENVENMNSRIDTLISKFKLKNRRYNGKNITKENLQHDYSEAYKILEKERKKSKSFLAKALRMEAKNG